MLLFSLNCSYFSSSFPILHSYETFPSSSSSFFFSCYFSFTRTRTLYSTLYSLPYFFLSSISFSSSMITLSHYYLAFLFFIHPLHFPSFPLPLSSSPLIPLSPYFIPFLLFLLIFFLLSILSFTIAFSVFPLYYFLSSSRSFYSSYWHPLTALRPAFSLPSRSPGPPRLHYPTVSHLLQANLAVRNLKHGTHFRFWQRKMRSLKSFYFCVSVLG